MRARCSDPGFTLIEVLVALIMSSILVVIILDGAQAARSRSRHTEQTAEAIFLARSLIERGAVARWTTVPELGRSNDLDWRIMQTVVRRDPRGIVVLARIRAEIVDLGGHPLFSAELLRLKLVHPPT